MNEICSVCIDLLFSRFNGNDQRYGFKGKQSVHIPDDYITALIKYEDEFINWLFAVLCMQFKTIASFFFSPNYCGGGHLDLVQ